MKTKKIDLSFVEKKSVSYFCTYYIAKSFNTSKLLESKDRENRNSLIDSLGLPTNKYDFASKLHIFVELGFISNNKLQISIAS